MINIVNKEDCCGCKTCSMKCPVNCIMMIRDDEGFSYPKVDIDKCINCSMCEEVCPVLNPKCNDDIEPEAYVAYNIDDVVRDDSTSGGVFSVLAEYVLLKDGVVFGVGFDEEFNVCHSYIEKSDDLGQFRGSKYVESNTLNTFNEVSDFLKQDRYVLYSGTPCQIEGLLNYIGNKSDKLLLVDIFCHGVGSPLYWEKYIEYQKRKYRSEIERVKFREKTYGFLSPTLAIYFNNGKVSKKGHDDDLYWRAFSNCYIFRPSCYKCKFKKKSHVSDFSIGDYWSAEGFGEKFESVNGLTLVMLHSEMAKKIVADNENKMQVSCVDINVALTINGGHQKSMYVASSAIPKHKDRFMSEIDNSDVNTLTKKYIPTTYKIVLKGMFKPILHKFGLLEKIKRG